MGSVAKHVFLVTDPAKLEATVRTAFEIARSGRPGPVVIDVPKDVQNWQGDFAGSGTLAVPGFRQRMAEVTRNAIDDEQAARFFAMLGESRRPLIYAGGGVIHGGGADSLRRFAETFDIPVVTTLMGIGAVDTTSRLSLRMLGMHGAAFANYAVDDCDFLIALGARFDDRVAGVPAKFARGARHIAHIDADASEINKVKRADWSHVGMLPAALAALRTHGQRTGFRGEFAEWHAHLDGLRREHAMNYDRDSELIQPYYVIEEINRLTRGEAIIATGVGQHQMWAAQYFDFRAPRLWLTSGSMGTMGFGLPAAIGAQFACRDRLVIDIDGDASVRMNLGELETVTTYDLPVKVVVLNNFGDGMVKQWQKLFFKGRLAASDKSLHKKDFVKAAQADGFGYAVRLERKADVPRDRARVHRVSGSGLPRGHDRSGRGRLPDGRSRPELRRDDHRAAHPLALHDGSEGARRLRDVLRDVLSADVWRRRALLAPARLDLLRGPGRADRDHAPRGRRAAPLARRQVVHRCTELLHAAAGTGGAAARDLPWLENARPARRTGRRPRLHRAGDPRAAAAVLGVRALRLGALWSTPCCSG